MTIEMRHILILFFCIGFLSLGTASPRAADYSDKARAICQSLRADPARPEAELARDFDASIHHIEKRHRGDFSLSRLELGLADGDSLRLDIVTLDTARLRSFRLEYHEQGLPRTQIQFDGTCEELGRRQITYGDGGKTERLLITPPGDVFEFNPPTPTGKPTDTRRIRIAHIDSGVDYTNPKLAPFLAYGPNGDLIGHDFWDDDRFPFDADTALSPFFPQQHGSFVLDILAGTGAPVAVMPYRYPRPDMSRVGDIVRDAAQNGARIVMIPLGSRAENDWISFRDAALDHPDILFVFSAGNDGVSLDDVPIYPAVFSAPHFLTVTSLLPDGTPGDGSNIGRNVDFGVVGEKLPLSFTRARRPHVSGTSFALPRMVGLLACLMAAEPSADPARILGRARGLAIPSPMASRFAFYLRDEQISGACDQFRRTAIPE